MKVRFYAKAPVISLFVIFLGALFIRLFHLSTLPLGVHADEIMNGYVGRYIIQNGVDLYGNRWPLLYFDNFGDFPNVLPMYLSGAFTYLFGPTTFAIRFPIALFGALTVFPLYGVLREIFVKKWVGLVGALLLASTPWHIVLSRATAEGVTAGFVFMCAMWFVMVGARTVKLRYAGAAALLCGLTYFLYPSYRALVPLVWLCVPLLWTNRKHKLIMVGIMAVFMMMTLGIAKTEWGRGRFEQTSIFASGHEVEERTQRFVYGSGGSPVLLTRMFHNKGVVGAREFAHQYMTYFSGEFLFSQGGLPERYKIPDVGLVYYAVAVILLLALTPSFVWKSLGFHESDSEVLNPGIHRTWLFVMLVILLIPIPAALTRDDVPNVHRTALLGIIYIVPVMYAFARLVRWRVKKMPILACAVTLLILCEGLYFYRMYSVHMNSAQALWRHDEIHQVLEYISRHASDYDVVMLPSHHQMALRYLMSRNDFSPTYAGQFKRNIYIDHIDNIEFYETDCPSKHVTDGVALDPQYTDKKLLVIDRVECDTVSSKIIKTIQTIPSTLHVDVYRVLVR